MIIYNNKELSSRYVQDNKIVEINSPIKDIGEAIETLRAELKKETPDLSKFVYAASQYSDKKFEPLAKGNEDFDKGEDVFNKILSKEEYESLSDNEAVYQRPQEFIDFEHSQFNMPSNLTFITTQITPQELLNEMMASYGILPTLWDIDKPIAELKTLSNAGENLTRKFNGDKWKIAKFNPVPPLDWIERYQALTPYEKRLVNDGRIHPAKMIQLASFIKEANPGALLTVDMLEDLCKKSNSESAHITAKKESELFISGFADEHKDVITRADAIFKEKFHGHSPRVLSEYVQGALIYMKYPKSQIHRITDEELTKIADGFNQQNVARIAKYKNPILLGLSGVIDYSKQKDSTIQILGSLVPESLMPELERLKFPEWLNLHPDIKPEDMCFIISKAKESILTEESRYDEEAPIKLNPFDINLSVKDTVNSVKNAKGFRDCKLYENQGEYKAAHYDFSKNEIAIKGRNIVCKQGNLTMRMLKADDYANFTIGYDTHCCQHFGDAGGSCVYKYTTDPFAAAVVIERGSKVVAQGFVWVDTLNSCFVFDNVELDADREVSQFSDLFAAYAAALPYKNVQVGTGYNQGMAGWGKAVTDSSLQGGLVHAILPTTVDGRKDITSWGSDDSRGNCYSDYHVAGGQIARTIKQNGAMLLREVNDVQTIIAPDEPTKWDELATPDLCFMLNDWQKPIDKRIDIAKKFRDNPSPEVQMQIIKDMPAAIAAVENPCEEVQNWILQNHIELIDKIMNPIQAVSIAMLDKDPSYISKIDNPTFEQLSAVVNKDASFIDDVLNIASKENLSTEQIESLCKTAVASDGYKFKDIPEEYRTPAVQLAAAESTPKIIASLTDETAILSAIHKEPDMIALCPESSETVQLAAVETRPATINSIQDPYPSAVTRAISLNGLLIRNFQRQYPELRMPAIRQNPYALRCLYNQLPEEIHEAVSRNRDCAKLIKDDDTRAAILAQIHMNEPVSVAASTITLDEPTFA